MTYLFIVLASFDHFIHLEMTFNILKTNILCVKKNKYSLGVTKIDYLVYVISTNGVAKDKLKVEVVLD